MSDLEADLEAWAAGGQTPPVNPADVKALFEFMRKAGADLKPGDTESTEQPAIGFNAEVLAQVMQPGSKRHGCVAS